MTLNTSTTDVQEGLASHALLCAASIGSIEVLCRALVGMQQTLEDVPRVHQDLLLALQLVPPIRDADWLCCNGGDLLVGQIVHSFGREGIFSEVSNEMTIDHLLCDVHDESSALALRFC